MSEKKLRRLPLAAAALVACMSAQADYQSPDGNFRLSGFGTLGVARSSTNEVGFNYLGQGGGAGTTPNPNPDSKLAVQGTYKVTPAVSFTTQIMTKYDAFGSYEPKVDWAFAKWQALPALTLRGGRMGGPFFMISDFRDVGYANTAIRPALDVYAQVPVSQFEGADATYQTNLGSATLNATVYAGDSKADYASARKKQGQPLAPSEFTLSGLHGLNLSAELDNGLTFRVGKSKGKVTVQSPSMDQLVAATGPGGPLAAIPGLAAQVNQSVVVQDNGISFTGFGVAYDQDNWVISAEYTKRRSEKFISSTTGWYGNVGYRVGKFTPFVGLSRLSVDRITGNAVTAPYSAAQLAALAAGLPGTLAQYTGALTANGGAAQVSTGVQALLDTQKLAQRTTTLGFRWDAAANVDVKVQWDHVTKPAGSYGLFFTEDPYDSKATTFRDSSRRVNILSLAVDVVF
ncbi:MAG: hypothetical protein HY836_15060 [Aquabacterium sp.]|uniref:hypothetical protein n=1 Tax=Aquabacterium sp. TaxID=1872578 RepID=UPI0025B8E6B8|nr:hypothetical protein [Aquabacterium sp.]MBI5926908.1 hypothetical protein [Aquabacterium sp.]